jgi:hypothetical protein
VARAALELTLPAEERRLAAALAGPWDDLLYAPGPGFSSELDPGCYRTSLVVRRGAGGWRLSSVVQPAWGGELCRLRLERVPGPPAETLGSFFDLARPGRVYAMGADRSRPALRSPQADWSYAGPSLAGRLGRVGGVALLREHVTGRDGGAAFAWTADRGLLLAGADGALALCLAEPDDPERAAFLPALGPYRALIDEGAARPGAGPRELLGYGDRADITAVRVERLPLPAAGARP